MSYINNELINAAINKAYSLTDYNIHDNIHKQYEFKKQIILSDESLTDNEKYEAIKLLNINYDEARICYDEGTKRVCENCNQECLAISYCELCVRNYLKENFSNWTSGNDVIDKLLRECQMNTVAPRLIPEWIPYNNFENIKYLTKGGFSEIYTADWIDGKYEEWDSKEQQLKRYGGQVVALKRLDNVGNINQNWLEEARLHLTISNKWNEIVQCYGLTQDPSSGNYMLVMNKVDVDLRKYLQQNYNKLTWSERIQIAVEYKNLMERCWDADPLKRPDTNTLLDEINELNLYYQNQPNEIQSEEYNNLEMNNFVNYTNSKKCIFTSKLYHFENLPEPRNATEAEQEVFHSKSYDFRIPNDIADFNKTSYENDSTSIYKLFKVNSKKLFSIFKSSSENDIQNDYKIESIQQQTMKYLNDNDYDEICNSPNLHSEEQDKLELPNGIDFIK
ncbi:kinase-like domain-containing protein [Rhizophagus clarus]|uniref:Kinase-like domain-containing protein n=1 Tax=Rhizophagus clarus TaxID=94130 RepID=A0A8H3KW26_9GLOM|nr:kinase-like domain-containing protein [Rhizophagus clarus]